MGFEALTDPTCDEIFVISCTYFPLRLLGIFPTVVSEPTLRSFRNVFYALNYSIFDIETLILLRDQICDIWLIPQVINMRFNLILMGVTSVS